MAAGELLEIEQYPRTWEISKRAEAGWGVSAGLAVIWVWLRPGGQEEQKDASQFYTTASPVSTVHSGWLVADPLVSSYRLQ